MSSLASVFGLKQQFGGIQEFFGLNSFNKGDICAGMTSGLLLGFIFYQRNNSGLRPGEPDILDRFD